MTLGERLRALRRTSRAQVAQEAGISVSHLERLERGKSDCTTAVALALAKALGVPIEALLDPCPSTHLDYICTGGSRHFDWTRHRDDRYGVSW